MYIKIHLNNKPLFLCDEIEAALQSYIHREDTVFIDELNTHTIKAMFHEIQQTKVNSVVFYHADLNMLKEKIFKKFTVIKAAGGFIKNEKGELLLIYRRKKWDLPKGKLDKNETAEAAAIREVQEETGINNLKSISYLTTTWHTYIEGSHNILKETQWFRMNASGKQEIIPQTEEDIEKIVWVKKDELPHYLKNSYPSIEDVFKSALA